MTAASPSQLKHNKMNYHLHTVARQTTDRYGLILWRYTVQMATTG